MGNLNFNLPESTAFNRRVPKQKFYENCAQAWIGYKEASGTGANAFTVSRYYHTDWMPREALRFTLAGLTLDEVYENLVRNIHAASQPAQTGRDGLYAVREAGTAWREDLPIPANIARDTVRARLEKQIAALEKRTGGEAAEEEV